VTASESAVGSAQPAAASASCTSTVDPSSSTTPQAVPNGAGASPLGAGGISAGGGLELPPSPTAAAVAGVTEQRADAVTLGSSAQTPFNNPLLGAILGAGVGFAAVLSLARLVCGTGGAGVRSSLVAPSRDRVLSGMPLASWPQAMPSRSEARELRRVWALPLSTHSQRLLLLAAAAFSRSQRLWAVQTGRALWEPYPPLRTHVQLGAQAQTFLLTFMGLRWGRRLRDGLAAYHALAVAAQLQTLVLVHTCALHVSINCGIAKTFGRQC
jgi:hypothetical protein